MATYLDKYPNCKGCPVFLYCGVELPSTKLCNSYDKYTESENLEKKNK